MFGALDLESAFDADASPLEFAMAKDRTLRLGLCSADLAHATSLPIDHRPRALSNGGKEPSSAASWSRVKPCVTSRSRGTRRFEDGAC